MQYNDKEEYRLKKMLETSPLSGDLWGELAIFYAMNKRYSDAIEAFQYQLVLQPDNHFVYYHVGECYLEISDCRKALENFLCAKELSHSLEYNAMIGHCYFELAQYDLALEYLLKTPVDSFGYYAACRDAVKIFSTRGNWESVRQVLFENLQVMPDDMSDLEELLPLSDPEKDREALLDICLPAIDAARDIVLVFRRLMSLCCQNGHYDLGLDICGKFASEPKLCLSIGYYFAALNILRGDVVRGCQYLENAILICPENYARNFRCMDCRLESVPQVVAILESHAEILGDDPDSDNDIDIFSDDSNRNDF